VESYLGEGPTGSGNLVRNNCLFASNSDPYYNQDGGVMPGSERGYETSGNIAVNPLFIDREAKNFQLQSSGRCASLLDGRLVTLQSNRNHVDNGQRIALHGQATPPNSTRVIIQVLRHGHWRKFATTKMRSSGKFALHKRLRLGQAKGRARFRARVPRVGRSRPVALRVRS
jgi:hypothetical protein